VERLQSALGIANPSGSVTLGSAVFEPAAIRVSNVQAILGSRAGGPAFIATSDRHVVTISLDASQQSEVKTGDAVTVTLPDGSSTPGLISSIGKVASGSGSSATIPVYVTLAHAGEAGTLDQAPVTVTITAASARNVLTVPVSALLAQASGGYAVEVAGPGSTRHLVPVTTGIFDDDAGLVEVDGAGLAAGQHVVVPSA
jgi:multidrug efflux pump subunit AcrA (membrane-fusion protein)